MITLKGLNGHRIEYKSMKREVFPYYLTLHTKANDIMKL